MEDRIAHRLFGAPHEPEMIGAFVVEREIGHGGMGSVYLCRDTRLENRLAAVKVLKKQQGDGRGNIRLLREANALAMLSHPNVVPVFEVGRFGDGQVFIAMEWVQGQTLQQWLPLQTDDWRTVIGVFVQAGRGLAAAHEKGIVHRDFKPSNVLLGNDGRVRVVDFGLAHGLNVDRQAGESDPAWPEGSAPTLPSRGFGTPEYMSPEQRCRGALDARSDQWSYCHAINRALFGGQLLQSERVETSQIEDQRLRGSKVPKRVRLALVRGLSEKPSDRWEDMNALLTELEAAIAPNWPRRIGIATASSALVTGLVLYVVVQQPPHEGICDDAATAVFDVWGATPREATIGHLRQQAPEHTERAVDVVISRLDRHRDLWAKTSVDVCYATAINFGWPKARSMSAQRCLQGSLDRMSDVINQGSADPKGMLSSLGSGQGAMDGLYFALGDPRSCLSEVRAPGPKDEYVIRKTARADVLMSSGDLEAACEAAEEAVTAASKGSVLAQVRSARALARCEIEMGWTDKGTERLLNVVDEAEAASLDEDTALAWIALANTALMHNHDRDLGQTWSRRAVAAVARIGTPPVLELEVERLLGVAASMHDEYEQAERHFAAALHASSRTELVTDLRVERIKLDQANAAIRAKKSAKARALLEEVRVARSTLLGSEHPAMAAVSVGLGRLAKLERDPRNGERHFQNAVALVERGFGSMSPRLSSPLVGLAWARFYQEELKGASTAASRAAEVQARLPKAHPDRGGGLAILGAIAESNNNREAAVRHYLAAADATEGLPDHRKRREAMNNAAWQLNRLRRPEQARPLYEWIRLHTEERQTLHLYALAGIARADDLTGHHKHAVTTLEALLLKAEQLDPPDEHFLAELRWHLADAMRNAGGDRAEVSKLARQAQAVYSKLHDTETVADLERISQPTYIGPRGPHER